MTNSITIGTTTIHQSDNGLYLLTDLWKASGGLKKDRPTNWLILESTKKYIAFLGRKTVNVNKSSFFLTIQGKDTQGTYVCKTLVYSYAMWISPEYHDLVITTFDELQNASTTQELIDLKFKLDNAMQQDLLLPYQQPRDANCLQVLMKCSPFAVQHFYDELEYRGEVKSHLVPQPPKRVFTATDTSKYVIGRKGDTLLFSEDVVNAFPDQNDWTEA